MRNAHWLQCTMAPDRGLPIPLYLNPLSIGNAGNGLPATGIVSEGDYHDPVYCERKGDAGPRDGAGRRHPGLSPETVAAPSAPWRRRSCVLLRRRAIVDRARRARKTGCFRISASSATRSLPSPNSVTSRRHRAWAFALGESAAVSGGSWWLWSERRAAYRELSALDDRMLRDIGITRGGHPGRHRRHDRRRPCRRRRSARGGCAAGARSRAAAQDLNALDNRTLDDIGMVRGDIEWVAEELAVRSLRPANTKPRVASRVTLNGVHGQ